MILNRSFAGQVVNSGFSYVEPQGDSTPDAIAGQTLSNVQLTTLTEFAPVQITGIDTAITASITGGEMSVSTDGTTYGAFSSANQTIENNYWIIVRATSSATNSASTTATLSAGGVSAAFVLVTWSGVYITPKYLMIVTESRNFASASSEITIPAGTYTFSNDGTYIPEAPSKDPSSTIDYGVYWTDWLAAGDEIESSQWLLDDGISSVSESRSETEASIMISGGVAGTQYTATNRITTSAGRVQEASMYILCENR